MELLKHLLDIFLHIDKHLSNVIADYGMLTYAILCAVIFIETGFVVMPFLPGDSLLFAAGAFAAQDALNIYVLIGSLSLAAVLGDTVNYWIGWRMGQRAYTLDWVNRRYLEKAQAFYETYGAKTVVLARFVPIVRTFAPFVAGIGRMPYGIFIVYNLLGGLAWVLSCSLAGYFFGSIPVVKANFELVVLAIILASILPILLEIRKARHTAAKPLAVEDES